MSSSSDKVFNQLDIVHNVHKDGLIDQESDVSRITNEVNSKPNLSRTNLVITNFVGNYVLDNNLLSRNIRGEEDAFNGLDDDPMARFDMRSISLGAFLDENGNLKQEFVKICQSFDLDAQQLIELIHTAFSTAWNFVADGDGKIHDYLLEHLEPSLYEPEGSKKYKKTLAQLLQGANQLIFEPLFSKDISEMSEEEATFTGGLTLITDNQIAAILNDEEAFNNFKSFATNPLPLEFLPYVESKRDKEELDIIGAAPRSVKQSSASKWGHRLFKGVLSTLFTIGTSLLGAGIGFLVGGPIGAAIGAGIGTCVGALAAGGTWGISSLLNRRSSNKQHRGYELVVSGQAPDPDYNRQHKFMNEILVDREKKQDEVTLRQRNRSQQKRDRGDVIPLVIDQNLVSDEDNYSSSSSLEFK